LGKPTKLWVGLGLVSCVDHAVIRIYAAIAATNGLIIISASQGGHGTNTFNVIEFHFRIEKKRR